MPADKTDVEALNPVVSLVLAIVVGYFAGRTLHILKNSL